MIENLRRICLSLPSTAEIATFGHPAFQVSGKTFCVLDAHKGEQAIAIKVGVAMQGIFLEDARFYRTPYIGKHGWVSLRATESAAASFDWEEIEELVNGSYRLCVPKRGKAAGGRIGL